MTREADSQRVARIVSRRLVIGGLVGALALAGMAATVALARSHSSSQTVLTSYKGRFGYEMVVEMKGQKLSLFAFGSDSPGKSTCYSQKQNGGKLPCDKVWYPLIDHGKIVATNGSHINTKQLKTFKRTDGSLQLKYYGQPLYRCHRNTKTGQIYGEGDYEFGAGWLLMGTGGSALTPSSPTYGTVPVPKC